jgi:hypothetical protein
MALLLSDEKQTHLAHVILQFLEGAKDARLKGDSTAALREIKRVLAEHVKLEEEMDQLVRMKLKSYSRPIPEGSQEWNIMYQKAYTEELRKRKLA